MKKLLLICIFILAILLRLYQLDEVPPALFSDEVDLGYQAYSFLKAGRDYFGNRWPVSFHSFADFRAPFYIYSTVSTIKIFGLNELGVRLPAVIFGVLGIIAFFLLAKEITASLPFSLLATLFLTIAPWHFHFSRAGFEATAIFFLVAFGLWLFFRALRRKSYGGFLLSLSILSLGFYTYATARLFLPLLGISAFFIFKKEILQFGWKRLFVALLVICAILSLFVKDSIFGGGLHRFSYLNIFSDSNLKFEIDRQRLVDATHGRAQVVGMKATPLALFFHNKPVSWLWVIINNYFSSFSTSFLFLKGDPNLRHGVGNFGEVLVVLIPFLIFGLVKILWQIERKEDEIISFQQALFWLIFLLLVPIPSSITYDGGTHATRLFLMIMPLTIMITAGAWNFFSCFKRMTIRLIIGAILTLLIFLNSLFYFHQYFYHYPLESERFWHAGFREGINSLKKNEKGYDKVIISNSYEPPLIFFLFWSKFSPSDFNIQDLNKVSSSWFEGQNLGKYYFGRLGTGFLDSYLPSQVKKENTEKILILAGRNDFGGDLEKEVPSLLKIIDKIYLLSKQPIFYLLRTKTFAELKEISLESR